MFARNWMEVMGIREEVHRGKETVSPHVSREHSVNLNIHCDVDLDPLVRVVCQVSLQ